MTGPRPTAHWNTNVTFRAPPDQKCQLWGYHQAQTCLSQSLPTARGPGAHGKPSPGPSASACPGGRWPPPQPCLWNTLALGLHPCLGQCPGMACPHGHDGAEPSPVGWLFGQPWPRTTSLVLSVRPSCCLCQRERPCHPGDLLGPSPEGGATILLSVLDAGASPRIQSSFKECCPEEGLWL